jgi:hypothetical protein
MKTNVEILSNISTDCEPVTLSCGVDEARNLWLDVTSYHDRLHLELCVEPLKSGGCIVYLEDWSSIDEIETVRSENYISIILIYLFLGAIICLS